LWLELLYGTLSTKLSTVNIIEWPMKLRFVDRACHRPTYVGPLSEGPQLSGRMPVGLCTPKRSLRSCPAHRRGTRGTAVSLVVLHVFLDRRKMQSEGQLKGTRAPLSSPLRRYNKPLGRRHRRAGATTRIPTAMTVHAALWYVLSPLS